LLKTENQELKKCIRYLEAEIDRQKRCVNDSNGSTLTLKHKHSNVEGDVDSTIKEHPQERHDIDESSNDTIIKVKPKLSTTNLSIIHFYDLLRDRATWLIGLLFFQSCSGFILSRNEVLLQKYPIIVYFLTMLVGAGGNAGNQASVRVIRSLALGTLHSKTIPSYLLRELAMAFLLSILLSMAGFIRAIIFLTPIQETIAVTTSLSLIVFTSVCFGALLPLLLHLVNVDPAHSSTTIQVVMDILGVLLTVCVTSFILEVE